MNLVDFAGLESITGLDGLDGLRSVGDTFVVDGAASLAGLGSLEDVGDYFKLDCVRGLGGASRRPDREPTGDEPPAEVDEAGLVGGGDEGEAGHAGGSGRG
jgi:hypothetical protein